MANITIQNATAGAVFVEFSNGASHAGELVGLPGAASSISWADGSSWVRANPLPLTVYLVPHSHNDPGWKSNLEQLYDTEVRAIYTTFVEALLANPERTFGAEIGVFWTLFWGEQNETMRDAVRGLVTRGQLEFVGGGYVQPDEAATSAPDLIDNLALGHLWVQSAMGHAPVRVGWQADPFGHSTGYSFIQSQAAFNGLVFGRPMSAGAWGSDPVNSQSGAVWHPLASQPGGNGGAFDDYSMLLHDHPGYWEPGRDCEGPIAAGNATAVAVLLGAFIRGVASRPPYSSTVLVMLGDDFYWQSADAQLPVVDEAIAILNKNDPAIVGAGAPLNVAYSTLSKWAAALRQEQLARGPQPQSPQQRQLRSGSGASPTAGPLVYPQRPAWDFFPLECCEFPKPWTGYYTSRPEFKGMFKAASASWRAATQLHSWARTADWEAGFGGLLPLWRALSLVQHHDAMTCDALDYIMDDYRARVQEALELAGAVAGNAIAALMGGEGMPPTFCFNATMEPCDVVTQSLANREPVTVTVYNSLSQQRDSHVELIVPSLDITITDAATGEAVVAQGDPDRGVIVFLAAGIPAHGFRSYILAVATDDGSESSTTPVTVSKAEAVPHGSLAPIVLSNGNITLTFTGNGTLTSVTWPSSDGGASVTSNASAHLGFYSSNQGDENAWDFSTDGSTTLASFPSLVPQNALLITGPVYSEVTVNVDAAQGTTIRWRLYANNPGLYVHVWTTAGPVSIAPGNRSIDVALQVRVDAIDSGASFATDSNGLELLPRVRDGRPWVTGPAPRPDEPVSHNYYPVTSAIAVTSESDPANGPAMALLTGSAQGGSSMCSGCLELGINRIALDGSGSRQTGNRLVTQENVLMLRASGGWPALTAQLRPLSAALANPLQVWASPASEAPPTPMVPFAPLVQGALPPNVQLLSLQTLPPGLNISAAFDGKRTGAPVSDTAVLLRLRHVYAAGEGDGGDAAPATVDLSALFAPRWTVESAVEYTIDAAQPMAAARANQIQWNAPGASGDATQGGDYSPTTPVAVAAHVAVTLQPMDIRTFVVALLDQS